MIKTFLFGSKPIKLMKFKLIKLKLNLNNNNRIKGYYFDPSFSP